MSTELELREREVVVKEREQRTREEALELQRADHQRSRWRNPLVLAVLAAAIAATGNAVVALLNGAAQRQLEDRKAEQARILEMIKTGDPDVAAENLSFLLEAGLLQDADQQQRIERLLQDREPGEGPFLSVASVVEPKPTRFADGRGGFQPEAIVIHTAATRQTLDGLVGTLANPEFPGSYHYAVGKSGEVVSLVPEENTAFHAGRAPDWKRTTPGGSPNQVTIGIVAEGMPGDAWTPELYASAARLLAEIARRSNIPLDRQHVLGHGELDRKLDCPGAGVDLERLVREALEQFSASEE